MCQFHCAVFKFFIFSNFFFNYTRLCISLYFLRLDDILNLCKYDCSLILYIKLFISRYSILANCVFDKDWPNNLLYIQC